MYVFIAILIGFISAFLSGMFGIGGAGVSTPAIRLFLDASPAIALGTTLPVTIPTAATGAFTYWRRGFLDKRVAWLCCVSGSIAAVAGAVITRFVNLHYLMVLTGLLILYVSVMTMRRGLTGYGLPADLDEAIEKPPGHAGEGAPDAGAGPGDAGAELPCEHVPDYSGPALKVLGIGLVAGILSGLLGVGGGVALIPGFLYLLKMPIRKAFATSLAVIAVIAIPGTIVHSLLHHISWSLVLYLAAGSIPGSYLGARLNFRTADRLLYLLFGALLAGFGVLFIVNEMSAMLR